MPMPRRQGEAASRIERAWRDGVTHGRRPAVSYAKLVRDITARLRCCGIAIQRISVVGAGVEIHASAAQPHYLELLSRVDRERPASVLVIVDVEGHRAIACSTRDGDPVRAWVSPMLLSDS